MTESERVMADIKASLIVELREEILSTLYDLVDYFDGRIDINEHGGPNAAMVYDQDIRKLIRKLGGEEP